MTATKSRLPVDREGVTHRFRITSLGADGELVETNGYVQTGCYEDGRLGEIFIKIGKPGSEGAVWDQLAIVFSIALQHGVALEELCGKLRATRFEPSGATSNQDIPRCTSVSDYLARWLLGKYGKPVATVDEAEAK